MRWVRVLAIGIAASLIGGAAFARDCVVSRMSGGDAVAWRGGARLALSLQFPLQAEDRIVTGPLTQVEIRCDDGSFMTIGAATEIGLGDFAGPAGPDERGLAARLIDGLVGLVTPAQAARSFEVRTPSAVASVRSTVWIVAVEDGATAVFVRQGVVDVLAAQASVTLSDGDGVDISPDGALATPPSPWSPARIDRVEARLEPLWR